LQFVAMTHDECGAGGQERSEPGLSRAIALDLEYQLCEFGSISHRRVSSLAGRGDTKLCWIAHIASGFG